MPSAAQQYLEMKSTPEIMAVFKYVSNSDLPDESKERSYPLLCSINSKITGVPSRVFTQAELDYQIGEYKSRVKTIIPNDFELSKLADGIIWHLQPIKPSKTKQELFTESDAPKATRAVPAAAVSDSPAEKPAEINLKQFIIPGIMVGAFILWKMGAFDGIMKNLGIGQPVDDDNTRKWNLGKKSRRQKRFEREQSELFSRPYKFRDQFEYDDWEKDLDPFALGMEEESSNREDDDEPVHD